MYRFNREIGVSLAYSARVIDGDKVGLVGGGGEKGINHINYVHIKYAMICVSGTDWAGVTCASDMISRTYQKLNMRRSGISFVAPVLKFLEQAAVPG